MAYNGINFNRARMPARQGIIDPSRMGPPQMAVDGGSMRQGIVNAPTMREALMQQSGPQRSVAEILSEPLGEMTPDLGGATSAASRQRQIADMLLQGAQQQDNTSIAGGLSQLGQAFLARRAGQKADTAEDKQREMASLLLQQAMQGGEQGQASLQQLLTQNPDAAMQYAMKVNAPPPPKEYGFQNVDGALVRTDAGEGTATELIAARPKPVDLPEGMIIDESGNRVYDPVYLEGQERLRRAGASKTTVDASTKGEDAFKSSIGKTAGDRYYAILDAGQKAATTEGNLQAMETLLNEIDYTGFGGTTLLNVQRAGAMVGLEIGDDIAPKEAAQRLSNELALGLKENLPGPMSNADREFLLSIPPNLNVTDAGNDALIFLLRQRTRFEQAAAKSLLEANPQSLQEYQQWERRFQMEYGPVFTPEDKAQLLKDMTGVR
jgi:hypothetical protein